MDSIIKELYNGYGSVKVGFKARGLPSVRYCVTGLGDESKSGNYADQWKLTGGVEGSFEYEIHGEVASPSLWEGYNCNLMVNVLGSGFRAEHESKGLIGDGWCDNNINRVLLRLYVKPSIARDILENIIHYNNLESKGEHYLECTLINLKHVTPESRNSVGYDIVGLSC